MLIWPDLEAVDRAARTWAADVAATRPEIRRVGYFGSYARGDWGVGSDLDLVAVVERADAPFERRSADWPLERLPVPADLLVYTEPEWNRVMERGGRFAGMLTCEVIWVWP